MQKSKIIMTTAPAIPTPTPVHKGNESTLADGGDVLMVTVVSSGRSGLKMTGVDEISESALFSLMKIFVVEADC